MARIRVLHVDDAAEFADLTARQLEQLDDRFEVETATSATDGLERLAETDFDCVVSDYDMPDQSGLDLLDRIRADHGDLPVILFTGKGSEEVASDAIARGVTDYLQKGANTDRYELLANRITNAVDQRRASDRAEALDRVRRVIRDVNQALVRADSRAEIERRVCEIVSEADPYLFAWIGEHDPETQTVRPRESAGIEAGYLDTVEITTDDRPTGRGPTGQAVNTRELAVMQDILSDPKYEPWRSDALERGYRSSAAIPLVYEGRMFGVLNVYADRAKAFDDTEQALLAELGDDVAHAIAGELDRNRRASVEAWVDALPVGVFRVGPDGRVVAANPALADVLGMDSVESIRGAPAADVLPDQLDLTAGGENRQTVGDEQLVAAWQRTTVAGTPGVVGMVRQTRELPLMEHLVAEMNDGAVITQEGIIEYVNPRITELVGIDAAELVGRNMGEFIAPEYRETVRHRHEARLAGTDESLPALYEIAITDADGREIPVEINVSRIEYEGEPATISLVRDVSERKERKAALEAARRRFQAVFNNPSTFMALLRTDGSVIDANETALSFIDATEDDVGGAPFWETPWWEHDEALQADLRRWIDRASDGERVPFEADHYGPDGDQVTIDGAILPIRDDDGAVISLLAVGRDISDRKERERALEERNERLAEFTSIVSHDLRNPLNVAQGQLTLARDECESDHLAAVEEAHQRMAALIEDLLALARTDESDLSLEPVDLTELCRTCWQTVETGDATLETEAAPAILADRSRLRQLLENLFRNAVEHGGPTVTVTVGGLPDEPGFFVADDGAGIPASEREAVFDSGYTTAEDGTGYGLNIVADVVETHDWTVDIADSESRGTRFEIRGVDRASE